MRLRALIRHQDVISLVLSENTEEIDHKLPSGSVSFISLMAWPLSLANHVVDRKRNKR